MRELLTEGVPEDDMLRELLELTEGVLHPLLLREGEPEDEAVILPVLLALIVALLHADADAH